MNLKQQDIVKQKYAELMTAIKKDLKKKDNDESLVIKKNVDAFLNNAKLCDVQKREDYLPDNSINPGFDDKYTYLNSDDKKMIEAFKNNSEGLIRGVYLCTLSSYNYVHHLVADILYKHILNNVVTSV